MKKENIINLFFELLIEAENIPYIEKLLYVFSLLFVKINCDTLENKKHEYEKRFSYRADFVQRLMNEQLIVIKQDWKDIYNLVDLSNLGYYINQYLYHLEENNLVLKGAFYKIDFTKIPYTKIKNMLIKLNDNYLAIKNEDDKEELKNAIEEILLNTKQEVKTYKFTAGDDFTPKSVSKLIAKMVEVKENEIVGDLTCGSGGLLLKAVEKVTNGNVQIYAQDKDEQVLQLCKLNFILHGIYDGIFKCEDTINGDLFETKFDVIVSNPPFSVNNNVKNMAKEDFYSYSRIYKYGIPPASKADYAFIQNMLQSLKVDGRMATLISLGALSREGPEEQIRINMLKDNIIDAIILLPQNLFKATGIRTCIMILKKMKNESDIVFIDATNQFVRAKSQNDFNDKNLENIFNAYKNRENIEGFCYVASLDEVLKNEGNLSVNKYVSKQIIYNADYEQLQLQINDLEEQLKIIKDKKKFYEDKLK